MTDTDEVLARMAARLNPEPPPWPDQREEVERLQAANENLNHRVLCLQHENRGLYAKLELYRDWGVDVGTVPLKGTPDKDFGGKRDDPHEPDVASPRQLRDVKSEGGRQPMPK